MDQSLIEETAITAVVGLVGVVLAYGVGLGIVLAKGYRDPYNFYDWPAGLRGAIWIFALGFGAIAIWNGLQLCGYFGGLIRLCGLLP